MKLVIQIPCYNEQDNILNVLKALPCEISGIDEVKIFVIDDGSSDKTIEIAKSFNVHKIIKTSHHGLSNAFRVGVKEALEQGADILVNIDGDNQYCAYDIEKLITPILDNSCDIVIGVRPIDEIKTFSPFKKFLQKFGSLIVKLISKSDVKDAASGFRAFNKNALLRLNIFNPFSYTIESIIQAKIKNLTIKNIDIRVNPQKNRKSKLFKNTFDYIFKQAKTLIRFYIIYRSARFFILFAFLFFIIGLTPAIKYLYFYFNGFKSGHIQSLILCAIFLILSFICATLAIVGDLLSINRKLLEDIQYELRTNKYKK